MSLHTKFHQLYQFCPQCGNELEHGDIDKNSVQCNKCGNSWYDNPAASTSIALIKDGKILLAKRGIEPKFGEWDILGGFIEAGESCEEAVIREMKEETGLDVEIKEFLGSVWDIYNERPSIPFLYLVEAKDPEQKPIAQDDVADLQWFSLKEIPQKLAFRNVEIIIEKVKKYLKD
ncbi:MAG: hypothetical protein COU63_00345 [Candidatus Pacebacteria bacterium CG10_big_fil_rev_8_21_14_0_10_36_11]|nr:NUDIX hydrolase [Candidatus Pacearchaeota archaeon]OIP74205.1 MAG: hypothetical protein AUK08_03095 [Candidatus Pacebacteria bacterium CG2_30_36_39]PIR65108.1 MAG: hypothetical protein COU63_00345 [Candidatus Pacebacteria bacterium CG10_big_fil_rev_8_21_14_0_10_36_11]PJC42663.1 MAG: hypothetical protein CO040_03235 [Candidatus Pacebacteria bacterium CG_4_9_14_0_2_um_filter_36_8]